MTIQYGEGRCFHTTLGHDAHAMTGVAFQISLQRGTEWAATGTVTLPPVGSDVLTSEVPTTRDVAKISAIPNITDDDWTLYLTVKTSTGGLNEMAQRPIASKTK